ncbi:uncharacterized protein LOC133180149 [Saccostrea echinata]|uniref:uncharacterized protein LOC133180149 n=1 Tax=Saccostrea echinata TaxID=191078 RepID=UPI002A7F132D|nr:uncharacterized protein LOC133180149 [Saccostrea echinata]
MLNAIKNGYSEIKGRYVASAYRARISYQRKQLGCKPTAPSNNVVATVHQGEPSQQGTSSAATLPSQPLTNSTQGNVLNTTGPLHSGRPLGQSIDKKLKAKIWAEEYIQLGALLFKNPYSKLQAVQGANNEITFQHKEQKFYLKYFTQWINAFHIFVSIYCEKFPNQSSNMMKYMAIVQKLNADVGEKAALYYDEQFRLWRADSPSLMPWQLINQELHSEALQIGLKTKIQTWEKSSKTNSSYTQQSGNKQQPFRARSQEKGPCFSFNNNAGKCLRTNCDFPHICLRCQGQHHKRICTLSSEIQPSPVRSLPASGNKISQTATKAKK